MDRQGGFARLTKHLRDDGEVVTYDRRGYGRSRAVGGPFEIADHVDDLMTVIDRIPTILVGHSLGGVVALAAAGRRPDLVRGVVVFEVPMSWEPWWPTDSGGSVAASMSDRPEDAAEAFMRRVVGSQRWDRLPERTRVERRSEGVALVGEMTSIRRGRPWNPAEIVCPVVSGHGRGSRPQFERSAHTIGETVGEAIVVAMSDARHNAHSDMPEEFRRCLIEPMLQRLRWGSFASGPGITEPT